MNERLKHSIEKTIAWLEDDSKLLEWCDGDLAVDSNDNVSNPQDDDACKWCAAGRMMLESGIYNYTDFEREFNKLTVGHKLDCVVYENDNHGRAAAAAELRFILENSDA